MNTIDHIGMAVRSLTEARRFYEEVLGLTCQGVEEVASQQVRIALFTVGEVHIELLEPTSEESPIARFLAAKGEGIHHIAYAVADIRAELTHARAQGCRLINETPIPGAHGKEIAFLHPKSTFGVLTELAQQGGDQEDIVPAPSTIEES